MAGVPRLAKVIGALAVLLSANVFAQPFVNEIERLLHAGDAQRAYELALRRSPVEAGDPSFDMAFGRAAIAAQHPEQAVFALERVLASQPDNDRARLELARASLMLGDHAGARQALDTLLAHNPPETLRREAQELRAQTQSTTETATPLRAYAELRYGYDTNVSSASSVTGLGVYTTNPNATASPANDHFTEFALGLEANKAISPSVSLFGAIAGTTRNNLNSNNFDARTYDARVGGSVAGEVNSLRLSAQGQQYVLGGAHYRRLALLVPEWGIRLTASQQLAFFGQFGNLHYPTQPAADVNLQLLGATWIYGFSPATQLALSLYHGVETAGADDATIARKYFGRRYDGARARLRSAVTPEHILFLSVAAQQSQHAANDPTFLALREDRFSIAEAGWHWRPARAWTWKAEFNYYRNNSTIAFYEYHRTQTQLGVRYDFF